MSEINLNKIHDYVDRVGIENIRNVIAIEKRATNGNVLKALYNISDDDIDKGLSTVYVYTNKVVLKGGSQDHCKKRITFNRDWWDAPYQAETLKPIYKKYTNSVDVTFKFHL